MPNVERTLLIINILNNDYFVRDDESIADEVKTDIKKYIRMTLTEFKKGIKEVISGEKNFI
jgi:hypothetical protein